MPPEPCTWIDEHPEALGARRRPEHLDTCAPCRTRLDTLEQALRKAFDPPPVPFPPELEARILAAIAARSAKPRRSLFRPVAFSLTFAGAAAALVLFLVLRPNEPPNRGSPKLKDIPTGAPTSRGCGCAF